MFKMTYNKTLHVIGSNGVHTKNYPLQSSLDSSMRPPLGPESGCLIRTRVTVWRSHQMNRTNMVNAPEFGSNGLNEASESALILLFNQLT